MEATHGGAKNTVKMKNMVKLIVSYRSSKTDAYAFREKIVHKDKVKDEVAAMSK